MKRRFGEGSTWQGKEWSRVAPYSSWAVQSTHTWGLQEHLAVVKIQHFQITERVLRTEWICN